MEQFCLHRVREVLLLVYIGEIWKMTWDLDMIIYNTWREMVWLHSRSILIRLGRRKKTIVDDAHTRVTRRDKIKANKWSIIILVLMCLKHKLSWMEYCKRMNGWEFLQCLTWNEFPILWWTWKSFTIFEIETSSFMHVKWVPFCYVLHIPFTYRIVLQNRWMHMLYKFLPGTCLKAILSHILIVSHSQKASLIGS